MVTIILIYNSAAEAFAEFLLAACAFLTSADCIFWHIWRKHVSLYSVRLSKAWLVHLEPEIEINSSILGLGLYITKFYQLEMITPDIC